VSDVIHDLFLKFLYICIYDDLFLSRDNVDKRTLMENLDLLLIAIDEIVDEGYDFPAKNKPPVLF